LIHIDIPRRAVAFGVVGVPIRAVGEETVVRADHVSTGGASGTQPVRSSLTPAIQTRWTTTFSQYLPFCFCKSLVVIR